MEISTRYPQFAHFDQPITAAHRITAAQTVTVAQNFVQQLTEFPGDNFMVHHRATGGQRPEHFGTLLSECGHNGRTDVFHFDGCFGWGECFRNGRFDFDETFGIRIGHFLFGLAFAEQNKNKNSFHCDTVCVCGSENIALTSKSVCVAALDGEYISFVVIKDKEIIKSVAEITKNG